MKSEPASEIPVALTIEKPVYGGDFLSHLPGSSAKPGKAVFVPLTLPGEQVTAQITEDKRNFAKAEILEVLIASVNRIQPQCRHFGVCGGCQYQNADYTTQLSLKEQVLRETFSRADAFVPVEVGRLVGNPWEYRNRIRLALVDGEAAPRMGYRGRRSHTIVPIMECPIACPGLLKAAEVVRDFLSYRLGPVPVSEMELFTNQSGSGLLVTLFFEDSTARSRAAETTLRIWMDDLLSQLPDGTGLRVQMVNGSLSQTVLGTAGASEFRYRVGEFEYSVEHGAFFQVNRHLIDQLLDLVTDGKSGKTAWDLFAGVGLFARRLTQSFANVIAVESAPASTVALKRNLGGTAGHAVETTTLEFLRCNRAAREPGPDLIVLDPPRAGLGNETTSLLNAIGAPRIVYVSCDPATLARDLKALTAERYRVNTVTLVDMFPQTFHIETVVELSRA